MPYKQLIDNAIRDFEKRWGVRPNGILMHMELFGEHYNKGDVHYSLMEHDGIPIMRTTDIPTNVIRFVL